MSGDGFGPAQRGGRGGRGGRRARDVQPLAGEEGAGDTRRDGNSAAPGGGQPTPAQGGRASRRPRVGRRRGHPGPRRPRLRAVLVAVVVAVVGFGVALTVIASVRLERTEVEGLQSAGLERTNVLVAGGDSRGDLTQQQLAEIGTERVDGNRADSLFLLSTQGTSAALLALPRDLYVTRCDGQRARINSAANPALGGPSCLVRTVSELTGLPVSHYVELNLADFVDVVNALGGVTITLDQPVVDRAAGADLPAGRQKLDGTDALGLVRSRRAGGDLARVQRQHKFLQAVMARMTSPTTLLNPWRLARTTYAGAGALTADAAFGPLDLARLGGWTRRRRRRSGDLHGAHHPAEGGRRRRAGARRARRPAAVRVLRRRLGAGRIGPAVGVPGRRWPPARAATAAATRGRDVITAARGGGRPRCRHDAARSAHGSPCRSRCSPSRPGAGQPQPCRRSPR